MRVKETYKIYNDSDTEYVETWKEKDVRIPARGYIIMGRRDAVAFMGSFSGYDPEYPERITKPLRKVLHESGEVIQEGHVCNICGLSLNTPQELTSHLRDHGEPPAALEPGETYDSSSSIIAGASSD